MSRAPYLNLKDSSAIILSCRLRNCLVGAVQESTAFRSFVKHRSFYLRVSCAIPFGAAVAVSPDAVIRIFNFYVVSVSYQPRYVNEKTFSTYAFAKSIFKKTSGDCRRHVAFCYAACFFLFLPKICLRKRIRLMPTSRIASAARVTQALVMFVVAGSAVRPIGA